MRKIVPDPPSTETLEDLLNQISEYLSCAEAVAEQSAYLHAQVPVQSLTLATLHEIQNAHSLVSVALGRVQSM